MRTIITPTLVVSLLMLTGGLASADCHEDDAAGIAKDGTIAPLEATNGAMSGSDHEMGNQEANVAETSETDGVSKDGSTMPLETDQSEAMSSDDVRAQQQGDDTAAASADNC